jgi:hypothetical protein
MRTTPRSLVTGLLAATALVTLSACGQTSVFNVEVGQCFNLNIDGDNVSSLPIVDCAEPHTGEIYALPQMADGDFSQAAVDEAVQRECFGPSFQSYVGTDYQNSAIYASSIVPTQDTWDDGDREIICYLEDENGAETTGSWRGANL